MIERKNYAKLGEVVGPYSHSVRHGNTLYTSGLTALGYAAQRQDIGAQTRAIFTQLQTICAENSTSLNKLIKVTLFVQDMTEIDALRDTLFDIYGSNMPASSLVKVDALFSDEISVEVEAIIAL